MVAQHTHPTVTQKQCKKCHTLKHASEFCKSKWGVDGLHSRCDYLHSIVLPKGGCCHLLHL